MPETCMMKTLYRFIYLAGLLSCNVLITALPAASPARPSIVLILADDVGFSDLGCYGSEIETPNLDRLAGKGLRFTHFYNTARCCPTRASLLTGLYPHQAGVGHMIDDRGLEGYQGELNRHCVTIAEALKPAGYRTYAVGKWHVSRAIKPPGPQHNWPLQRGFDRYYGTLTGAGSYFDPGTLTRDNTPLSAFADPEYRPAQYYYTDAITDHAVRFIADHQRDQAAQPFFLYVAYTAAHWPLHAKERDIAKYKGRYDAGYEPIRQARFEKQKRLGLIDPSWKLSPGAGQWSTVSNRAWEARCMEVYAAQIECLDQGVGRITAELEKQGLLERTLILFLQDNGGCAEALGRTGHMVRPAQPTLPPIARDVARADVRPKQNRAGIPTLSGPDILPGPEDTFISYGKAWANVSDTPFREYKHWVHEGGIATPLIAHWPAGITARGEYRHQPGHLIDLMATCLDLAGAKYPAQFRGQPITPLEGRSLVPAFANRPLERDALYWEHEGNRAVQAGPWKLVAKGPAGRWELYDLEKDRTEMNDLAGAQPERVKELAAKWETWAKRSHVLPWVWKPAYGQASALAGASREGPEEDETLFAARRKFTLYPGDDLPRARAPRIAGRGFSVTAQIASMSRNGVLIAQGGSAVGFSLYMKEGVLTFALRHGGQLTLVTAPEPLPLQPTGVVARLAKDGQVTLSAAGRTLVSARTPGPVPRMPADGLQIGRDDNGAVGDYEAPFPFGGQIGTVVMELAEP